MTMLHSKSSKSHSNPVAATGVLLGATAVLSGLAWCFKDNRTSRQRISLDRPLPSFRPGNGSRHANNWAVGALVAGVAGLLAGSITLRNRVPEARHRYGGDVRLASRIIVDRPPEEVYRYWRDFSNLPGPISFIEKVELQEGNVSHWVARGPVGPAIEWDAELVDDDPGKLLAWRSLEGSDLQTWGTVIFKACNSNNSNTELTVAFNFCPPANATGALARYLSGLENKVLDQNLQKLKSHLENEAVPVIHAKEAGISP